MCSELLTSSKCIAWQPGPTVPTCAQQMNFGAMDSANIKRDGGCTATHEACLQLLTPVISNSWHAHTCISFSLFFWSCLFFLLMNCIRDRCSRAVTSASSSSLQVQFGSSSSSSSNLKSYYCLRPTRMSSYNNCSVLTAHMPHRCCTATAQLDKQTCCIPLILGQQTGVDIIKYINHTHLSSSSSLSLPWPAAVPPQQSWTIAHATPLGLPR